MAQTFVLPLREISRPVTRDDEFHAVPVDVIESYASTTPVLSHVLDITLMLSVARSEPMTVTLLEVEVTWLAISG